jgi:UDP-N-acetylmuramyl pentapeptide phosphotransferase/UDP-N-acetylglucosamine-1-phosphate transferase
MLTLSMGLAALVSAALGFFIARSRLALDQPNARSMHNTPTPRLGGVALWSGFGCGFALHAIQLQQSMLLGALALVVAVSLLDDIHTLPPWPRLAAQLGAALLALLGANLAPAMLTLPGLTWAWPHALALPLCLGFLVWTCNCFNFMDGLDGLATTQAITGFAALAIMAGASGAPWLMVAASLTAAGALGFLPWNLPLPKARLFLGDGGAVGLGFWQGALTLYGTAQGVFPLWAGLLAFAPFLLDGTITLLLRTVDGHSPLTPHRDHLYQRLARGRWGMRRTLLVHGLFMLCCAAEACLTMHQPLPWGLIACLAACGVHLGLRWHLGAQEASCRQSPGKNNAQL